MVTASLYNLRRTNTGYRHSLGKLVFSSIALSLLIGWGLNSAGFGYTVDNLLGKNVDMYLSQDEIEWQLWQAPESGRLLGAEIGVENDLVIFQDVLNMPWLMDVNELHLEDLQALGTGETMHIIGVMTGEQTFTACGVLEWRYDSAATISQLQAEKERFAERIYSHFSMGEKAESGSICAEAAMVRRMEKVLH